MTPEQREQREKRIVEAMQVDVVFRTVIDAKRERDAVFVKRQAAELKASARARRGLAP